MAIFLRTLIWRDQIYPRSKSHFYYSLTERAFTMGIGIAIIKRSVMISVTVKMVNTFKVLGHWVKKSVMGAQLRLQFTPHWKTFAKKNVKLHVATIPIMTQLALLNPRTLPKIRSQRNKTESFMRPKAIRSVVWNPYLYYERGVSLRRRDSLVMRYTFSAWCSFSVDIGQSFTTGEWPVMTCCTHPDKSTFRGFSVKGRW